MDESDVSAKVKTFIEELSLTSFEAENIDENSDLFEQGVLDSHALVEVVMYIQEEFGIVLDDDDMLSPELSTLRGMTKIIASKLAQKEV